MEKMKKAGYTQGCRLRHRPKESNNRQAKEGNFRRLCRNSENNETSNEDQDAEQTIVTRQKQQKATEQNGFIIKNYNKIFDIINKEQPKYSLRHMQQDQQNNAEKYKSNFKSEKQEVSNDSISTTKELIEGMVSYIKQEYNSDDDTLKNLQEQSSNANQTTAVLKTITDDPNNTSESVEKAYLEFLAKKMYLGKDYRRQHIIDYLRKEVPGLIKIKKEYFENGKNEVQIFEDESNINLRLSERLDVLLKLQHKYTCAKNLAKSFNCEIEDIHKTLKRHIKYVKEWEDIKLYSPHSSFSIEDLDKILYLWTMECTINNYPITKNSIKHSAHPIAKILDLEMFKASDCWLDYFVNKYGIQLENESQHVLELAAESVRIIRLSDVITKYSHTLSKSIQEKFANRCAAKPFTYKKKIKKSDASHAMYFKIKKNSSNLKMDTVQTKNSKKETAPETSNNNSALLKNIKQEPIFDFFEPETFHKNDLQNQTVKDDVDTISSVKRSINLILEQNMNSIDNKKRKVQNYCSPETYTTPNIIIESYEHALRYIKPLEDFVMLKSDFRAINYLNCLQNTFKELNKS